MTEEAKSERQQGVQQYVSSELSETNGDVLVSYHLTSIYDHSTLEAFSKVSCLSLSDSMGCHHTAT
jgi:hypothetical protein